MGKRSRLPRRPLPARRAHRFRLRRIPLRRRGESLAAFDTPNRHRPHLQALESDARPMRKQRRIHGKRGPGLQEPPIRAADQPDQAQAVRLPRYRTPARWLQSRGTCRLLCSIWRHALLPRADRPIPAVRGECPAPHVRHLWNPVCRAANAHQAGASRARDLHLRARRDRIGRHAP